MSQEPPPPPVPRQTMSPSTACGPEYRVIGPNATERRRSTSSIAETVETPSTSQPQRQSNDPLYIPKPILRNGRDDRSRRSLGNPLGAEGGERSVSYGGVTYASPRSSAECRYYPNCHCGNKPHRPNIFQTIVAWKEDPPKNKAPEPEPPSRIAQRKEEFQLVLERFLSEFQPGPQTQPQIQPPPRQEPQLQPRAQNSQPQPQAAPQPLPRTLRVFKVPTRDQLQNPQRNSAQQRPTPARRDSLNLRPSQGVPWVRNDPRLRRKRRSKYRVPKKGEYKPTMEVIYEVYEGPDEPVMDRTNPDDSKLTSVIDDTQDNGLNIAVTTIVDATDPDIDPNFDPNESLKINQIPEFPNIARNFLLNFAGFSSPPRLTPPADGEIPPEVEEKNVKKLQRRFNKVAWEAENRRGFKPRWK